MLEKMKTYSLEEMTDKHIGKKAKNETNLRKNFGWTFCFGLTMPAFSVKWFPLANPKVPFPHGKEKGRSPDIVVQDRGRSRVECRVPDVRRAH